MNMDVITAKMMCLSRKAPKNNNSSSKCRSSNSFEDMLNGNLDNTYARGINNKDTNNVNTYSTNDEDIKKDDMLSLMMILMQQGYNGQTGVDLIQGIQSDNITDDGLKSLMTSLNNQNKVTITDENAIASLNGQITNLINQLKIDSNLNNNHAKLKDFLNLPNMHSANSSSNIVNEAANLTKEALTQNNLLNLQQLTLNSEAIHNSLQNLVIDNPITDNAKNIATDLNLVTNVGEDNTHVNALSNNKIVDGSISLNKADVAISSQNMNKSIDEILLVDNKDVSKVNVEVLESKNELDKNIVNEALLKVNGVKLEANEQIIKVSDESSRLKDSVITQIKDQITFMKVNGKQTITLELTPESLGKLDIKMIFDNGKLIIDIMASNPKTQSLILSNISELQSVLQSSLSSKAVINVEVQKQMYEDGSNHHNYEQEQQNHDENEKQYEQGYKADDEDTELSDFLNELSKYRNNKFSYIN